MPNYDAAHVSDACTEAKRRGVRPLIMIDSSHANSGKNPENQPRVIASIADQVAGGDRRIIGAMIESNLVAGRQDLVPGQPLVYGQSITDGCIDWETSIAAFATLAEAVRRRRRG